MLGTIAIILIVFWLLGLVSSYTMDQRGHLNRKVRLRPNYME